jgi:hypothetical protein
MAGYPNIIYYGGCMKTLINVQLIKGRKKEMVDGEKQRGREKGIK